MIVYLLLIILKAGPEFQAELLKGLGLSGYIMTDGNNPINLFNTANGNKIVCRFANLPFQV